VTERPHTYCRYLYVARTVYILSYGYETVVEYETDASDPQITHVSFPQSIRESGRDDDEIRALIQLIRDARL